MIIAHDNSWCICSPKKTATHSLMAMLVPTEAGINGYDFARLAGGWHDFHYDGGVQHQDSGGGSTFSGFFIQ